MLVSLTACESDPNASEAGDTEGSTSSEDQLPSVGWVEVSFGEAEFAPLRSGGELRIVWGNQGAAMFPMTVRGADFTVPSDPSDFRDDAAPELDVQLDIAGEEPGFCGHFKCLRNYPMSFDVLDNGTYEMRSIRVIVPDGVDVDGLNGRQARLRVELTPRDSAPLVQDLELTVVAEARP